MKKAQAQEVIEATLVAAAIFLLLIFLSYEYGEKTFAVRSSSERYILEETSFSALLALYDSQLPVIEKFSAEVLVDSVLQSKAFGTCQNLNKVFYGTGIGRVNASDVVRVFDNYFGNRWKLVVETSAGKAVYGHELNENRILYVVKLPVPVPDGNTGKISLIVGKPK